MLKMFRVVVVVKYGEVLVDEGDDLDDDDLD